MRFLQVVLVSVLPTGQWIILRPAPPATAQALPDKPIGPKTPIPSKDWSGESYGSWSLFLVCNLGWL
jgi:hypothetical protein